jgi:hypothetical protein
VANSRNGFFQIGREGLRLDHGADLGAGLGQGAHVFGVQRVQSLALMRSARPSCQELAEGVGRGGKAGGHAHAVGSWEIISPRLAFLPPTASTSVILRFSNGTTRAVGLKSADMGKLQKLKTGSACGLDGLAGGHARLLVSLSVVGARCMVRIG